MRVMRVIGVIRYFRGYEIPRAEFEELLRSAGYEVLDIIEQRRREHPRYNIGKGKLEELKERVEELKPDKVVFANRLTPSQAYNLWKELGVDVIDKWQLVLEIFERRAHSKEAKLQVELASLRYEVPLVKEAIRRIKLGDRAGFKGMGEYQSRQYLKHIRYRMGKIRKELERVKEERKVRRKKREEAGFLLVALAGYTNAGKSTLLNSLAGEELETAGQMFTTLSTTTRRFKVVGRKALVTDTVGFIDGLPPFIVDAFHSTLEEIVKADVILLVIDVSEPWREIKRKFLASMRELKTLDKPTIVVLNKADLVEEVDAREKARLIKEVAFKHDFSVKGVTIVSAIKKNLNELYEAMERVMVELPKYGAFEIKIKDGEKVPKVMALISSAGEVLSVKYGAETKIRAYIQTSMLKELMRMGVKVERSSV